MVNRSFRALAAACAVACCGAAHAAAAPVGTRPAPDKYQALIFSAAAALAAHSDASSLATAAALRFAGSLSAPKGSAPHSQSSALDLAARASELAPQNPSIGWLHLQLCSETPSCDIRDAATAMRWVDADNGAAWLPTLAIAQKDKDAVEVERILADMAQGARFDLYWNRIIVLMADALYAARRELPNGFAASDASRLIAAEGIATAEIIPRFSPLVDACREPGTERRELCIKLAKTMQRGDTIIAQLVGLSIEKRLRPSDGKEARSIAERRHVLEWRQAAAAESDGPQLPWTRNAHARVRLAHMRILTREEDVCIAILREHNVALDPPEVHP